MKDFWLSCGHHLLDRDAGGGLVVTDDFLKVYIARSELTPPPEACVVERTLHAALLADPHRAVAADEIGAIADADARENWQVLIAFRDRLVRHKTLEAAYLDIVRTGAKVPHIFLNQLVHVILRNALNGCDDPFVLRAATATCSTSRSISRRGGAGSRRLPKRCGAGSLTSSISRLRSSRSPNCATPNLPGMWDLT